MDGPRVLVVEDEPMIAAAVGDRLRAEGFTVDSAGDGPTAVERARAFTPDVVVLDVMLPGFDGLEVCRRVQAERPVPVLMLTARDDETDVLVGLGVGADDYLTKPFRMRELVARVRALHRRAGRYGSPDAPDPSDPESGRHPLRIGPLQIDRASHRVRYGEEEVHLTPTEFDLLDFLARHRGTVFTRGELLQRVWRWADGTRTRTVDSHVRALRAKLDPDLIRTVAGVGYSLEET